MSNLSLFMYSRSYAKSQTHSIAERLALMKLARDKLAVALADVSSSADEKSKADNS